MESYIVTLFLWKQISLWPSAPTKVSELVFVYSAGLKLYTRLHLLERFGLYLFLCLIFVKMILSLLSYNTIAHSKIKCLVLRLMYYNDNRWLLFAKFCFTLCSKHAHSSLGWMLHFFNLNSITTDLKSSCQLRNAAIFRAP